MLLIVSFIISLAMIGINADIYDEVKNSRNFTDKVVLVTGSNSGIGEDITKLFSSLGAKVVVTGRNATSIALVAEAVRKLSPYNLKPLEVTADITVDKEAEKLINETIKQYGRIDVLVNNAGVVQSTPRNAPDFMQQFDNIMRLNLRAQLYISHLSIPYLEKSKGTIINISAAFTLLPSANWMAYSLSKEALNMMTKVLAVELGSAGIRVNAIIPAGVNTRNDETKINLTALNRTGEPIDTAKGVVFLASTDAQFITGDLLVITGGAVIR